MTRKEFTTLVRTEQEPLRRFLLALCCGDSMRADDLAQDTFMKAYLSLENYDNRGTPRAWLFRIAHNVFVDETRTMRPTARLEERTELADGDRHADRAFQYQELYAALNCLGEKERFAILLFYIQGYDVKEISQITGDNSNAVRKQLQRGRDHLRTLIKR